ncbi:MAG: XdhC family protein, partial [Verrucomicrobium sp.]
MKSLQRILDLACQQRSCAWALATLVRTAGSTYRKPGARLLVHENGDTTGVLSGGCLEEEIGRIG